tara:strand:- start:23 stop:208 length:186 start_codon:yes stop_codon:yes gene_type:complete
MEFIQNNIEDSKDINNLNKNVINIERNERVSYLYPDGHRITHQMRWFKGSRYRGLRSDNAA